MSTIQNRLGGNSRTCSTLFRSEPLKVRPNFIRNNSAGVRAELSFIPISLTSSLDPGWAFHGLGHPLFLRGVKGEWCAMVCLLGFVKGAPKVTNNLRGIRGWMKGVDGE